MKFIKLYMVLGRYSLLFRPGEYRRQLRNKIAVFKAQTATKKAVCLTLITTYGLVKNEHATSLVQNDLTINVLFGG
ncbi:MAG: hypothetical protein LH609_13050 [Rudanella sp.]|nr:hypothetical protein [Rudanella sp.]